MAKATKPKFDPEALDRRGLEAFTHDDVLARLHRIRDGALIWVEDCVRCASGSGSGAALNVLEKTLGFIDRIETRTGEGQSGGITITIAGYDPADVEVGDNDG